MTSTPSEPHPPSGSVPEDRSPEVGTRSDALSPDPLPSPTPPEQQKVFLNDLQRMGRSALIRRAESLAIRVRATSTIHHLILDQARFHLTRGDVVTVEGIAEIDAGKCSLRSPNFDFRPSIDDVTVPASLLRESRLRTGHRVLGTVRLAGPKEHGLILESVVAIEDIPFEKWEEPPHFDKLTALFPNERIFLEHRSATDITPRAIDLISPLGKGQRGLIVAPPRTGKTVLLKQLALAILANHPEICLMLLLVDERPEEVTDFRREIPCDIFASTFDESPPRHVQVTELVSERAKRLVELKKHVVILVDSITRLSRGYNNLIPGKGRTMSGGVDAKALAKPKKFFGSARNVEEGGSLTILATALVETSSRMDDLIFEEYKGTGNMEVHLDRSIADLRIFPAIHIVRSATRREELLYHPDELDRIVALRRQLHELPAAEAMEVLAANLSNTGSNPELLLTGLRGT